MKFRVNIGFYRFLFDDEDVAMGFAVSAKEHDIDKNDLITIDILEDIEPMEDADE